MTQRASERLYPESRQATAGIAWFLLGPRLDPGARLGARVDERKFSSRRVHSVAVPHTRSISTGVSSSSPYREQSPENGQDAKHFKDDPYQHHLLRDEQNGSENHHDDTDEKDRRPDKRHRWFLSKTQTMRAAWHIRERTRRHMVANTIASVRGTTGTGQRSEPRLRSPDRREDRKSVV